MEKGRIAVTRYFYKNRINTVSITRPTMGHDRESKDSELTRPLALAAVEAKVQLLCRCITTFKLDLPAGCRQ
jgi:hypothetical protein